MGYNFSNLKLQYYPTDSRICEFFTYLHFPIIHKDESDFKNYSWMKNDIYYQAEKNIKEYEDMMKAKSEYKFKKDWFKIPSYTTYKFQKDIIENQLSNTQDYKSNWEYVSGKNISVNDYFCGEGEWLVSANKYYEQYRNPIRTLGIELEQNRANISKQNGVNYIYNSAFEDVTLPTESASLLLFNPPYFNESKDERATKKYLLEILKKQVLIKGESFVDFVIREDDFRDCLDILLE